MNKKIWAVLVAGTALLAGCVVTSVYPFYTTKDLVFDKTLVGDWSKDKEEHWKFEQQGTNAYRLTLTEKDKPAYALQAHLFKLQDQLFLDLFNPTTEDSTPPPIPSHLVLRVFHMKPTLRMAALGHDWLKEVLEKDPHAIRHHLVQTGEKPEDVRIVLTDETEALQKFLIKYLKSEEAWQDPFELERDATTAKTETSDAK